MNCFWADGFISIKTYLYPAMTEIGAQSTKSAVIATSNARRGILGQLRMSSSVSAIPWYLCDISSKYPFLYLTVSVLNCFLNVLNILDAGYGNHSSDDCEFCNVVCIVANMFWHHWAACHFCDTFVGYNKPNCLIWFMLSISCQPQLWCWYRKSQIRMFARQKCGMVEEFWLSPESCDMILNLGVRFVA